MKFIAGLTHVENKTRIVFYRNKIRGPVPQNT
jgi:hypothetical protein